MNGKEVVMIFPEQDIGERVFPRDLSQYVSNFYKQKGVELLAGEKIVASEERGHQRVLETATEREIVVDGVVAGIGLEPNIRKRPIPSAPFSITSSISSCAERFTSTEIVCPSRVVAGLRHSPLQRN